LAAKYRRNGVYKDARTILAIHNLSHQGVDPAATFANLGLPDDMCDRYTLPLLSRESSQDLIQHGDCTRTCPATLPLLR
jgi:glycogen synthase